MWERKCGGHTETIFLVTKFETQTVSSPLQQMILESAPHELCLLWSAGRHSQPVAVSGRVAGYETRLSASHVETADRIGRVAVTEEIMNAYRILGGK
jgi:hypothetical protein